MPKVNERTNKNGTTTWFVRVRDADSRQTSVPFTNRAKADWFASTVDQIGSVAALRMNDRRDPRMDEYVPTLAEWLTQHIEQLTGVTDRTRIDYQRMADRTFLLDFGSTPLDIIDRGSVAKMINRLERAGLSAKSIANAHALLSTLMSSALVAGLIESNPCHKMRLPRAKAGDDIAHGERFLTHDEYGQLLEKIPERDRALTVLLFGTGLRWSEATALQVRDIRPGKPPSLRVTKAWKSTPGRPRVIGPPKSAKSRRTVMLPEQVITALGPLEQRPDADRLFTAPRGGPIHHGAWRDRVWLPACRAAGLASPYKKGVPYDGPRIHDARHSHASWLIEQGATLEMVQDQLGHESILTTRKVYGHLQPAMRAQVAAYATAAMSPPAQIES